MQRGNKPGNKTNKYFNHLNLYQRRYVWTFSQAIMEKTASASCCESSKANGTFFITAFQLKFRWEIL
jgi:hypothetical protein